MNIARRRPLFDYVLFLSLCQVLFQNCKTVSQHVKSPQFIVLQSTKSQLSSVQDARQGDAPFCRSINGGAPIMIQVLELRDVTRLSPFVSQTFHFRRKERKKKLKADNPLLPGWKMMMRLKCCVPFRVEKNQRLDSVDNV